MSRARRLSESSSVTAARYLELRRERPHDVVRTRSSGRPPASDTGIFRELVLERLRSRRGLTAAELREDLARDYGYVNERRAHRELRRLLEVGAIEPVDYDCPSPPGLTPVRWRLRKHVIRLLEGLGPCAPGPGVLY